MNGHLLSLITSYLILIGVMFILPFYSTDTYSIISNTTSHLGAQQSPNAWIMNITFVALGLSSIVAGLKFYAPFRLHRVLILTFGISLILAALYQHRPIDTEVYFNSREDKMHSIFSTITGFSFTLLSISTGFILTPIRDRIIALLTAVIATLLSLLIFLFPDQMGIWQRLMFITSFGWMIYTFSNREKLQILTN